MNYLNRLLAAACFVLSAFILPSGAKADNALVLASCGTAHYGAAGLNSLTMDQTGLLCASVVASLTFPTIGAAVPATGIYNGINVGGTLRGWSGLSTGSIFPGAVAIVDASGNQITSFGATGSTSNASSGVATSSTNVPTVGFNYGFNGTTWDQLQVSATKNLLIDTPTSNSNLYAAITAAVPWLATTAWNTNTYTNGTTNPGAADLHGAPFVDVGAINGVALLAGNGVTGTGSPRVTAASDNAAIPLWGHGATGAAVPANGTLMIGRAASTDPTAVTDGQAVAPMMSLSGKQVVLPFTIKELAVRGTADSTDGAAHTIIASAGGSLKNYITDWECSNTSATNVTVTFTDSASTKIIVPATGGNNKSLQVPLATAAATAFQFTASTGVSTVTCNAQGFTGL